MKAKAPVPTRKSPPTTCLALSGGNALGAYSAGAIEALEAAGVRFDLISGASIGAVSAAIVAGNPPGQATQALRRFWALGSSGTTAAFWPWMQTPLAQAANGTPGLPRQRMARPTRDLREMSNAAHAMKTLMFGRPGLFHPSPIAQLPAWPGLHRPMALFDPRPVVQTLERLLDFERLHTHGPRSSSAPWTCKAVNRCTSTAGANASHRCTCWPAPHSCPAFHRWRSAAGCSVTPG